MSQPSSDVESKPFPIRLQDHFASLTDPRGRNGAYPLVNVVTIAVRSVICGAADCVAIDIWGRLKRGGLATILPARRGGVFEFS